MALPNFRQAAISSNAPQPIQGAQTMMAGSPVSFNILKERLRSSPVGNQGAGFFFQGSKPDEIKANPFVQNQYGNSSFNPQRLGIRPVGGTGVPKPPRAPEKPLVPYMRYSRKIWDSVRNQNPDMQLWEIGKIIGQMWRDLADFDKQEFQDEYEVEKLQYDKDLNAYKTSPGYLAYVQAKSRGNPVIEDPEPKGVRTAERRIDIQPAEDEEDPDDGLSVKHIANSRFTRNHRLINEVFSETMVPDVRSVVTTARMQVLKRQVQSLTMHQKKLEAELTQIEEKYNQKKRKFLDSSEDFSKELKKHCAKVVDESKYDEMVNEQLEKLRMERAERARAGAPTPPSPTPPTDPADTRHVLQPVERGTDNPDSPQDESGKLEKAKEKDEKDEKMEVSSPNNMNGKVEKGNTASNDDKNGEQRTISNSATTQPDEPPLQYADMSNQKSLPTQPQMQPLPFGQSIQLETNSVQQSAQQESQQSVNVPRETLQPSIASLGSGNISVPVHQHEMNSQENSQQVSTATDQGIVKSPTPAADNKSQSDSQPLTAPAEPTILSPETDIAKSQIEAAPNMTSNSATAGNVPEDKTTSPNVIAPPVSSEAAAPQSSSNYTDLPSTSTTSSEPTPPPPVQGVPPSYPPQQQRAMPYGSTAPGYGSENPPYGTVPPPSGPDYPDPKYGSDYHNFPSQPETYPPSDSYSAQNVPPQVAPAPITPETAAVVPGNVDQNPTTESNDTAPVAGMNKQPSNTNEAPIPTEIPIPSTIEATSGSAEQNTLSQETPQESVIAKPTESDGPKNSASDSTNPTSTE